MSPEERIGAAVAAYLRRQGFAVYAEVVGPWGRQRPDIVAVGCGGTVHVVECKRRLGIEVLTQIGRFRGWAHARLVATGPVAGKYILEWERLLGGVGLGWLVVHADGRLIECVYPAVDPNPRRVGLLLDALRPAHQESRPGTASGEHYTQTQERDARLRAHVAAHPGVELAQALAALGLRMDADGRRAFARQLARGVVQGVQAVRDGRRVVLTSAEDVL